MLYCTNTGHLTAAQRKVGACGALQASAGNELLGRRLAESGCTHREVPVGAVGLCKLIEASLFGAGLSQQEQSTSASTSITSTATSTVTTAIVGRVECQTVETLSYLHVPAEYTCVNQTILLNSMLDGCTDTPNEISVRSPRHRRHFTRFSPDMCYL